jgi:hypothetical protein
MMPLCPAHGSNSNQPCTCWAYRPVPVGWIPCPVHGRNDTSPCMCSEYGPDRADEEAPWGGLP